MIERTRRKWNLRRRLTLVSMAMVALVAASPVQADVESQLREGVALLWGDAPAPPPSLGHLLEAMAQDELVRERVLANASPTARSLTHQLLTVLAWTEPEALHALPDLHVVRTNGPPPGERPPTWSDVRWLGVDLLERISLDSTVARDVRMRRQLSDAREQLERPTPSRIAGFVVMWQQWWDDRGDAPAFYLAAESVPNIDEWYASFVDSDEWNVLEMLSRAFDDGLRGRLLFDRLSPAEHAFLTAEAMEVLKYYDVDLTTRGVPTREWNAEQGRLVGYRAGDLRALAMDLLSRVTTHLNSGTEEHQQIIGWLSWWKRARFQARYHRDPRAAPSLASWVGGLDRPESEGGQSSARFIRELYVATGFRDLLMEQLGPSQRGIVGELMQWLRRDRQQAIDAGFEIAYRRESLRPLPDEKGELVAIPWPRAQSVIRQVLTQVTGDRGLEGSGANDDLLNSYWFDWWRIHQSDPEWHRGEVPPSDTVAPPRFKPERASG